jgi:hypothetical protein
VTSHFFRLVVFSATLLLVICFNTVSRTSASAFVPLPRISWGSTKSAKNDISSLLNYPHTRKKTKTKIYLLLWRIRNELEPVKWDIGHDVYEEDSLRKQKKWVMVILIQ